MLSNVFYLKTYLYDIDILLKDYADLYKRGN